MHNYPWLDEYLQSKAGCCKDYKAEWDWVRYQVGGRMFAAYTRPEPKHVAYANRELLTLKCDPGLSQALRDEYPAIAPGFYMDKRCWISVFLDGDLPEASLRGLCDASYDLVFSKLTKKAQREILAGE